MNPILKKEKFQNKEQFANFFKSAKRPGSFRGQILALKPESEYVIVKVPVKGKTAKWDHVGLPWTLAKQRNLQLVTRRAEYEGKPVLLVGIKKRK